MVKFRAGVLGASSMVGECLLPMLRDAGSRVVAFSRHAAKSELGVEWQHLPFAEVAEEISHWICVAPIWVLPDYFALLQAANAQRVVVLSSTSRFTKVGSDDMSEQATAAKLIDAETRLQEWAESRGIELVILRPTLIYGFGSDKNISEIACFIRRFGFFPVLGEAKGLRQPIHAEDVAEACVAALQGSNVRSLSYNISGGETLTYREMVYRIFAALGRRPRILTVPLWAFRLAVTMLRRLPRYRQWSAAMAERMNRDLMFDHTDALQDFGFKPRAFVLTPEDLPI